MSFKQQQNKTRKALAFDDKGAWQLQSIVKYTISQLEDINNLYMM